VFGPFAIYIMASYSGCLYTGYTSDLVRRVGQHREAANEKAFSARYRVRKLMYYELAETAQAARARERQIKKWRREKRVELLTRFNPTWRDLAANWPEIEQLPARRM